MRRAAAAAGPTAANARQEPPSNAAGQPRLDILESHTFEDDLGPSVRRDIEGWNRTVLTDGLDGYRALAEAGIEHQRPVVGSDRSKTVKLFPGRPQGLLRSCIRPLGQHSVDEVPAQQRRSSCDLRDPKRKLVIDRLSRTGQE